jgi:4'-phosphopantetheinyl transferase
MSEIFCGTIPISHENFNDLSKNTPGLKLFKIDLYSYYDLVPELITYLNVEELQRAQNYHFEKDRNQFIICRSLLKLILAKHSHLPVTQINVEIDANNKPYLSSNKLVCFNVSHAKGYALIAVNDNHPIGVDIEYLNNNFDFSEIMPDIYSPLEIETVLNATDKTHVFYTFWTRKEAIVKATGTGISDFLPQIPATDGEHAVDSKLLDGFNHLKVLSFNLNKDYIASIALSNKNLNFDTLQMYNLPSSIEGLISLKL